MIRIHAFGDWGRDALRVAWTGSTRRVVPEVEALIDDTWNAAAARLGGRLFDGPMCRLERWSASRDSLDLTLSRTSYKAFLGTNLTNPAIADRFGREVLADPVGLSAALETDDGWLLLGRRNDSVAYYPNRVHPFAGALEPRESLDVFDDMMRELDEELSLGEADLAGDVRCIGLAEDAAIRQPELIFHVRAARSRAAIEARLDREEHRATYAVAARDVEDVERAMGDAALTPVAVATLALWGRRGLGEGWFSARAATPAD